MKKILGLTCLVIIVLLGRSAIAQKINQAEYFFDTDPGVGKGTAIAISTPADSIDLNGSVSTTGLAVGFHRLCIRVKNVNSKWSLYEARNFYINAPVNNTLPTITAAEWFFDADPGLGKGTSIVVSAPGDSIDVNSSASTTGLSAGFHRLCVRVKNSSGIWSLYEARNFYINATVTNVLPVINAAEYFFDADPGLGKGHAITVSVPGDSVDINASVSTTGLTKGFHTLVVRVKNANGIWSLYDARNFYLDNVITATSGDSIVNAETFFDTDPGTGMGTKVSPSFTASDSIDLFGNVSATGLAQGTHNMFIRVQNKAGKWSLISVESFNICNHAPVALFSDSTSGNTTYFKDSSENAITYHWNFGDGDTSNVANPLHIYANPGNYTITLVIDDTCGSNTLNKTVSISTATGINPVTFAPNVLVYPNPNDGNFKLSYYLESEHAQLRIIDIVGRTVYSTDIEGKAGIQYINVSNLSSGLFYWQMVSGNQILSNGKIVIAK